MFGLKAKDVEAIRVLELGSYAGEPHVAGDALATSGPWKFEVLKYGFCSAEQALQLASLWNDLPPGETARCHVPGFAFQAYVGREVVFSAAICWKCNNISIGGPLASENWRVFDAATTEAQSLLKLCQEVVNAGRPSPVA